MKKEKGISSILLVIIVIVIIIIGIVVALLFLNKKSDNKGNNIKKQQVQGITLVEAYKSGIVKIGDYINYSPIAKGDSGEEGKYTYTSNGDVTGMNEYRLSSDEQKLQVFKINKEAEWRVWGLSEDESQIILVSEEPVGKETKENRPEYYLYGATGAMNGAKELNSICAIYGKGDCAEKAESLNIEDVNNICGIKVDKEQKKLFTKDGAEFKNILGNFFMNQFQIENSYTVNTEKNIKEGPTKINVTCDAYGYNVGDSGSQANEETNAANGKNIYDILFGLSDPKYEYWISSYAVMANSDIAFFGPGCATEGNVYSGNDYTYSSDNTSYDVSFLVRPKVTLKSNVYIDTSDYDIGQDDDGTWQIGV